MRLNPIRRSQLIAPFGPGALHVLEGGIGVVTGGLDHWFKDSNGNQASHEEILKGPLVIREPRLEKDLNVSHFRMAPGPENRSSGDDPVLKTPVFRFPTWFACPRCGSMKKASLTNFGHLTCSGSDCKRARLSQVRFAAVCDHGHLQDLPWLEWVHHSSEDHRACTNSLVYKAQGSGSLDSIRIECTRCNVSRSLGLIMQGELRGNAQQPEGWSGLSRYLRAKNTEDNNYPDPYLCEGKKSWLGKVKNDNCVRPLRAVLINATNVHYADVRSAIHIPQKYTPNPNNLALILEESSFRTRIQMLRMSDMAIPEIIESIKKLDAKSKNPRLSKYTDAQITSALQGHEEAPPMPPKDSDNLVLLSRSEQEAKIRADEYQALLKVTDRSGDLILRELDSTELHGIANKLINKVIAVESLKETRVFAGFSRLLSHSPTGAPSTTNLLWDQLPPNPEERWLPASVVRGEGIFLTFKEEIVSSWEKSDVVKKHIEKLQDNHNQCVTNYLWEPLDINPRMVLIHTLSHLLINRLVFECGYGSSSLRERLYVSSKPEAPMAGLLIYTAAGDSEGTLGGLVKLAAPENISRLISNSVTDAQWCSADPVCSEAADVGQGPESLNLAACHSCALLPETSCESFNRYLDRSVILEQHSASILTIAKAGNY